MVRKMPWLKSRLRELGKTPAALARYLKVDAPRIYEMIAGRRGIQPSEIGPTAQFLDWTVEQVLSKLPPELRVMPTDEMPSIKGAIPVLSTSVSSQPALHDAVVTGEVARYVSFGTLENRRNLFCVYLNTTRMTPWRNQGEIVVAEKDRPPRELDHVVLFMHVKAAKTVMIRQLMFSKDPDRLRVRQHNPGKDATIARKDVSEIYRVMTWDDALR